MGSNLEGLPFKHDRRLKGTLDYDQRLNQIALNRHTTYPIIFTEALEKFLLDNRQFVKAPNRVVVTGSDDWLFIVNDRFNQLRPSDFGATNTRALYRMAVGAYLDAQK